MGHIAELDWPGVIPVGLPRNTRPLRRVPVVVDENSGSSIARATPLVPRAAAEGVFDEACVLLQAPLPKDWKILLVEKAETLYRQPRFRARLKAGGNIGRDRLWNFMRHWLAALLYEHRPDLYRELPHGYAFGGH